MEWRRRSLTAASMVALWTTACSQVLDFGNLDTKPSSTLENDSGGGTTVSGYASVVAADRPFAYWRFEEPSGPRAVDAIGHADGTLLAPAPKKTSGALLSEAGLALQNEDLPSGMNAGTAFSNAAADVLSFEVWMKVDKSDDEYRYLFHERLLDAKGRQDLGLFVHQEALTFERYVDDVRMGASTSLPALGMWHHVVATYDKTTLSLYVDGARADTSPDARAQSLRGTELFIGINGPTRGAFLGAIDEAAVYTTVLSSDRVRAHVEAARSPATPGG